MVTSSGGADGETYMPVSMVQFWRLKKEGVVPGEGEGETLTVGNAQKNVSVPDAILCAGGVLTRDTLATQGRLSVTKKH